MSIALTRPFQLGVQWIIGKEGNWKTPNLLRGTGDEPQKHAHDWRYDVIARCPGCLGVTAISAQGKDKYDLKVPGGLAFSEFRGYERWQTISLSRNERAMALIVGNPAMIEAYEAGIPGNGKPFPEGAKMAKIHWIPKTSQYPGNPSVPATQHDVDFMVKDSNRFADGGGWGYAVFVYDAASDTFRPGTTEDSPPQGNDAKCGVACHTIVKSRDYVFTDYAQR